MSARPQSGVTLTEVLIALAILGILLAIAIPNLRTPAVRLAADAVQAFVQQARFEAIRLNQEVGVTLRAGSFQVRPGGCSSTSVRQLELSEFPQVVAEGGDFMWLPTGEARDCSSGSLGLAGISWQLSDGRRSEEVRVGPGGVVSTR